MHTLSTRSPLRPSHDISQFPGSFQVQHEEWIAEARRLGAIVIVSVTADNPARAIEQLAASENPMDCWFKDGVRGLTGEDVPTLFA